MRNMRNMRNKPLAGILKAGRKKSPLRANEEVTIDMPLMREIGAGTVKQPEKSTLELVTEGLVRD